MRRGVPCHVAKNAGDTLDRRHPRFPPKKTPNGTSNRSNIALGAWSTYPVTLSKRDRAYHRNLVTQSYTIVSGTGAAMHGGGNHQKGIFRSPLSTLDMQVGKSSFFLFYRYENCNWRGMCHERAVFRGIKSSSSTIPPLKTDRPQKNP